MSISWLTTRASTLVAVAVLLGAIQVRGDEADDMYATATRAYAEKQWTSAAEQLQGFLAKYPDGPKSAASRFFLAESQFHAGQSAAAAASYRDYLEKTPDGPYARPAMFRAGEAAWFERKLDQAKAELGGFLARYPEDPLNAYALSYLGSIALEDGDAMAAESLFRRALRDYPGGPMQDDCRLGLGRALEKLGKTEEAQGLYAAVAETPGSPRAEEAQFALASLQYAQGDFAEAANSFGRFDSRFAGSSRQPAARLAHGWALLKLGRHEAAQERFKSVWSDPQLGSEARYWLGMSQKSQKDWQAAAKTLLDAADHDPHHRLAGTMRQEAVDALTQAGQLEAAETALRQFLESQPEASIGAQAAMTRGALLERMQQWNAAIDAYQAVVDRYASEPQCPEALLAAARLHERLAADQPGSRLQHLDAAQTLYRRLAEEHPEFPQNDAAIYRRAQTLIELGQKADALPLFERLHADFSRSPYWGHATLAIAQQAMESRDYQRAKPLAAELLEHSPEASILDRALYVSGQVALAEGEYPEARRVFEQLIAQCPSSPLRLWAEFGAAEATFRQADYTVAQSRFLRLAEKTESGRHPLSPFVRLRVAQLQAHQRVWGDAMQTAVRLKEEFPGFAEQYEADYVIGLCKSNQADFAGAREAFEAVLRSPTGSQGETAAKAQYMIADSYFREANYERAKREYLQLEDRHYPELQAAAVSRAAACAEAMGQWSDAAELYARLLKTYPESSHVSEATKRLELARQQAARPGA